MIKSLWDGKRQWWNLSKNPATLKKLNFYWTSLIFFPELPIEKSRKKITSHIVYPGTRPPLSFYCKPKASTDEKWFIQIFMLLATRFHQTDNNDDDFLSSWFILFQWLFIIVKRENIFFWCGLKWWKGRMFEFQTSVEATMRAKRVFLCGCSCATFVNILDENFSVMLVERLSWIFQADLYDLYSRTQR